MLYLQNNTKFFTVQECLLINLLCATDKYGSHDAFHEARNHTPH